MSKFQATVLGIMVFGLYCFCAVIGIRFAQPAQAGSGEKLTYIDLINRLTDLEQLAVLPAAGEKCAQWSSYDRKSKYDQASGKYVDWAANGDGDGIIRKEDGKFVFAEMQGPGCIWRIWSALAKEGHVKIYLDGSDELAVDLPFIGYFNRKNEPFTYPALVHETAHGQNCYVPIPYQKSCKIVAEGDWGAYYHFTYTTYPKGTILPTFKRQLSDAESKALDKANEILSKGGLAPVGIASDATTSEGTVTIEPGNRFVATHDGPQAVTGLWVNGKFGNREDEIQALRDIVLQITCGMTRKSPLCGRRWGTSLAPPRE
jgi:hypothetical protein